MATYLTRSLGYTLSQATQTFTHSLSFTNVFVHFYPHNSITGVCALVNKALNACGLRGSIDGLVGDLDVGVWHSIQGGS